MDYPRASPHTCKGYVDLMMLEDASSPSERRKGVKKKNMNIQRGYSEDMRSGGSHAPIRKGGSVRIHKRFGDYKDEHSYVRRYHKRTHVGFGQHGQGGYSHA
ncbi:hypothetical protein Tco_0864057 [Tanacetum coccineum]